MNLIAADHEKEIAGLEAARNLIFVFTDPILSLRGKGIGKRLHRKTLRGIRILKDLRENFTLSSSVTKQLVFNNHESTEYFLGIDLSEYHIHAGNLPPKILQ